MNFGQMLVELGFKPRPVTDNFPCPAVILQNKVAIGNTAMIETRAEIDAFIDQRKTVAERAATKRSPGNWS